MNHFLVAAFVIVTVTLLPAGAEPDAVRRRGPSSSGSLPYICDLQVGKGTQVKGTPIYVRSAPSTQSCMESCQRIKKRKDRRKQEKIIGVSLWAQNVPDTRDARENKCWCLIAGNGGFTVDKSEKDWKTCMLYQKGKPKPALPYANTAPVCIGLGSAFVRKGCFSFANRGRYLVNRRYQIKWSKDEHSKFACDFVQACAQAAKDAGVMFFATHFWGECWEVNITEGAAVANGDGCSLADGLYKSKCAGTDLSNECLGTTNYYVYSIAVPRG